MLLLDSPEFGNAYDQIDEGRLTTFNNFEETSSASAYQDRTLLLRQRVVEKHLIWGELASFGVTEEKMDI